MTTAIAVDPEQRWAVPRLSGAATLTALSAGLLWVLGRVDH